MLPSDAGRTVILSSTEEYRRGVRNVGVPQILLAAPQLTEQDAERLLARFDDGTVSSARFAGPPLLVHGAVRVYALYRAPATVGPMMGIVNVQRFGPDTYLVQGPQDLQGLSLPHARLLLPAYEMWQAQDYALGHWLPCLRWDNWRDVIAGFILRPGLSPQRWWATTTVRMAAFPTEAAASGALNPVPMEIDMAIQNFTLDELLGRELQGDRLPFAVFNCGMCGGGVFNYRCVFCEQGYGADDSQEGFRQVQWPWPLPTKLALQLKGTFTIDPAEARKVVYARWSRSQFRVQGPLSYKEQRPVMLD